MTGKNPEYDALFKQSWLDVKHNAALFLPSILMFAGSLVLVVLFFVSAGFFSYTMHLPIYYRENPFVDFVLQDPVKIGILFLVYLVLEFMLATYLSGMKFAMAQEVIQEGKVQLRKAFKNAGAYFFKVLRLELLLLAIVIAPLLIFVLLTTIAFRASNVVGTFFLVFFVFLFALYLIYMVFNLVFVYPILFFEHKKPMVAVKKDFHYVRSHFVHTLMVWLIVIAMFLFFFVLRLPFDKVSGYSTSLIILLIAILLIYILEVIFSTWEHMFIMRAYLLGKKEKL